MFEKSLLDLVKGLRAHKDNPTPYVNQCLTEIKQEIKSPDKQMKSSAVQKLSHIYMLGYDVSWAAFNVIEVMSHPTFGERRIGYLCASLSFTEETDVIVLTTHLFKKAFTTTARRAENDGQYDIGCAVACLTNICTPELAQNLLSDMLNMLNSSRPYVRKKTTLCLYALFQQWPKALRHSFGRLKEKLTDPDPGVQTAAVNVICELASKNPKNYINIVPTLYDLLTTSGNNWMLIKLVKLMGELMPVEPRLLKKLKEPLSNIINNTPAKSLMYECINTLTQSDELPKSIVRTCLDRLKTFIEDNDQNLKYLGLLGLNKLMKSYPRAVGQYKDLIMQCIDDADVTIRMRALDLIVNMVSRKNIEDIVRRLQEHLEETEGQYREHVLTTIIQICSQANYDYIDDFTWYIALLVDLTRIPGVSRRNAELITSQLMDVIVRVPDVRDYGVAQMEALLLEKRLIGDGAGAAGNICNVLYAAAYVVGEFSEFVGDHIALMEGMLQQRVTSLPETVQSMFVQAALKIMCSGLSRGIVKSSKPLPFEEWKTYAEKCINVVTAGLECFTISNLLEVQERATAYLQLSKWLTAQLAQGQPLVQNIIEAFGTAFRADLNPVHPRAQEKVKVPKGVDLDEWIHTPPPSDVEISDDDYGGHTSEGDSDRQSSSEPSDGGDAGSSDSGSEKQRKKKKKKKKKGADKHANDAYYITGDLQAKSSSSEAEEDIPDRGVKRLPRGSLGALRHSGKRKRRRRRPDVVTGFVGQEVCDEEAPKKKRQPDSDEGSDDLGKIDLTKKAADDVDAMPEIKAYERLDPVAEREKMRKERKRKKKQRAKEEQERRDNGGSDGEEERGDRRKRKRRRGRDDRDRRDRKHRKHRKRGKDEDEKAPDSDPGGGGPVESAAALDLLNFGVASPRPGAPLGTRRKANGTQVTSPSSAPLDFLGFGDAPAPSSLPPAAKANSAKSRAKSPRSSSAPPEKENIPPYESTRILCSNSHVTVTYTSAPDSSASKPSLKVTFAIHAKATVKGVKLQLNSAEGLRLSEKGSTVRLGARLKPGDTESGEASVRCKKITPGTLTGRLSYHAKGSKKSAEDLEVRVSPASFVLPGGSMTLDGLRDVLSDGKSCRKERSFRAKPPEQLSRAETFDAIGTVMSCQLVDKQEKTATYYGELLFGKHVAALAKFRSNGDISIDVKSSDSQICEAFVGLLKERLR